MNSSDRINNTDRSTAIAHSTTLTTRGRPLTPAALPGPVAGALSGASGPELALEAAAACAVARRSIIPSAPVTALELPPAPTGPVISDDLADLLARMLDLHGQTELVVRTLRLIRSRGLRLPPRLLDRAAPRVTDRDHEVIIDLMDPRSRAIFAMDERWAEQLRRIDTRTAPLDPAVWEAGGGRERAAYMTSVRATDPAAGRALLADGAWLTRKAPERAQILAALATGLSPQDEPLITPQLKDRARDVRRTAADLLLRLPASDLVKRAEELARRHVVVTRRLIRAPRVDLIPVELTDELERDQYPADPRLASASLWRAREMVARVPPQHWPDLIGMTAADLLTAEVRSEGEEVDLSAELVRAAVRWRDTALAAAIAAKADPRTAATVFNLLDPPQRDALIERTVALKRAIHWSEARDTWPLTLSPRHSVALARYLVRASAPKGPMPSAAALGTASELLPGRCAPEAVDEALRILRGAPPESFEIKEMRTTITALELRRELLDLTGREAP